MAQIGAALLSRRLGEMQDKAQHEPIEIMKHGRKYAVLMGAALYDDLMIRARRNYAAGDVPDDILEAVKSAKMSPRHKHLDKLLKK